mmetsp:Transcript_13491/g.34608  ORF Transcript_13491/g.34608 Transcript_13491/m.34608 type:complete len:211 (+) Transcript_13491:95-727(+)
MSSHVCTEKSKDLLFCSTLWGVGACSWMHRSCTLSAVRQFHLCIFLLDAGGSVFLLEACGASTLFLLEAGGGDAPLAVDPISVLTDSAMPASEALSLVRFVLCAATLEVGGFLPVVNGPALFAPLFAPLPALFGGVVSFSRHPSKSPLSLIVCAWRSSKIAGSSPLHVTEVLRGFGLPPRLVSPNAQPTPSVETTPFSLLDTVTSPRFTI